MIIRIKKRTITVVGILLLLLVPLAVATDVARTFEVLLTVANSAPVIFFVNFTNADPAENGTVVVNFYFNASDTNGFDDLNHSSAKVVVTFQGQLRNSTTCLPYSNYSTVNTAYNCTVNFNYFDNSTSDWLINASVEDLSNTIGFNDTAANLTYSSLSAMRLVTTSFNFGTVNLGATTGATDNPFVINNTGNFDFSEVNVTAYDLKGQTDATDVIFAENFTVNVTNSAGTFLINETAVRVVTGNLTHGAGTSGIEELYLYVTMPTDGLGNQQYNSTTYWTITVS